MKTIVMKLLPGMLACLGLYLGVGWIHADPKPAAAAVSQESRVESREQYAAPARQIIVCGQCGAQLEAPQAVLVAQPMGGVGYAGTPGESFYGLPAVGYVYPQAYYADNCNYRPGAPPENYYPTVYRAPQQRGHGHRRY